MRFPSTDRGVCVRCIQLVRVSARSLVVVFGAFLLLVAMSRPASAATIQVTTTADENNTNPAACSLRV